LAKVRAQRAGLDIYLSQAVSWSRDSETGFYWKTTQELTTDTTLQTTKKTGKPIVDELPFKISDESDYSASMQYTGPDGKVMTVYLQVVTEKDLNPE